MNKLDKQYTDLLQTILDFGVDKKDRTGTGTKSIFGYTIRHKMSDGFPLITSKKMYFKGIATELIWFLRGDTNIKYLVDNDCHIWDGDCYSNYLKKRTTANKDNVREPHTLSNGMTGQISRPFTQEEFINKIKTDDEFAKKWGSLGKIYGAQWRKWDIKPTMDSETGEIFIGNMWIDQIANLINDLKTNPDSRRLLVSAWNCSDLDSMVLPPCHYGFQVYTRELSLEERHQLALPIWKEKYGPLADMMVPTNVDNTPYKIPTRAISLMWNARSQDVPLGTPFNIASYALLLEIIAKMVNMVPDELISNMGDCHIYLNQIDRIKEQLTRKPFELPKLVISNQVNFNEGIDEFLNSCLITDFQIDGYQCHPSIKIPLSN